ncbi:Methyltransferase domain-containing protein [uncultured Gammaproteobacteria bacterium]
MTDRLRSQYEAYPYPARNPADEDKRLLVGSPSHLTELTHYVFGGRLERRPLRVLVAGGGTGDAAIMIATQLTTAKIEGQVTYLDLSDTARAIAQARAERRRLTNIEFHQGSLLELGGLGPFDYIDCCGVLHHLDDPAAGLRSLAGVLAPGGGLGTMVYAPYGRSGVYPLQAALRPLTAALPPTEQIAVARRLLRFLPETNLFKHNRYLTDHNTSDAGLYDLLLHSCDRPYTVAELAQLVGNCGLAITALIEPARYRPDSYLRDPKLLQQLNTLPWLEQAAWAEQISGAITKHIAYLTRPEDAAAAVAQPDRPEVIPVLHDLDGLALALALPPGEALEAELHGTVLSLPLPRAAGAMLSRINGQATLGEIHQQIAAMTCQPPSWEHFLPKFQQLYAALNGIGKLFLRC